MVDRLFAGRGRRWRRKKQTRLGDWRQVDRQERQRHLFDDDTFPVAITVFVRPRYMNSIGYVSVPAPVRSFAQKDDARGDERKSQREKEHEQTGQPKMCSSIACVPSWHRMLVSAVQYCIAALSIGLRPFVDLDAVEDAE